MTEREKFIILVNNEPLKKADAIILLEGDGFFRLFHAVKLFKEGWASKIVVSGGINNKSYGSFPVKEIVPELLKMGIASDNIIMEEVSQNTVEQARNIITMAENKKWKKIILVASHYHQFRAFLTFLKIMKNSNTNLFIINSPARELPWFHKNKWGRRFDLLDVEFEKIEKYKNDVASFAEGIAYQQQKEMKN